MKDKPAPQNRTGYSSITVNGKPAQAPLPADIDILPGGATVGIPIGTEIPEGLSEGGTKVFRFMQALHRHGDPDRAFAESGLIPTHVHLEADDEG